MAATSEAVALAPELLLNVAFDSIGKRPDTREAVETIVDNTGKYMVRIVRRPELEEVYFPMAESV